MGVKLLAMGSYLPEKIMTNDDFAKFLDTNDEWIRTRTGITQRHMAGWEPVWYMGKKAAEKAIEKAGISPKDIGLVIVSTVTSDFVTPSIASLLQYELGIENAAAFDLNAACSGFVFSLDTARRFLETDDNAFLKEDFYEQKKCSYYLQEVLVHHILVLIIHKY